LSSLPINSGPAAAALEQAIHRSPLWCEKAKLLRSVPAIGSVTVTTLLAHCPNSIQQELRLRMALGGSLMAIKGYATPEAGLAYAQALELCPAGK